MPHLLLKRYLDRIDCGHLERDPAQEHVLRELEKLAMQLAFYRPARKAAALGWLAGLVRKPRPCAAFISGVQSGAARPC